MVQVSIAIWTTCDTFMVLLYLNCFLGKYKRFMTNSNDIWVGINKTFHMIVKRFGCMAIHDKALYKCIIHINASFKHILKSWIKKKLYIGFLWFLINSWLLTTSFTAVFNSTFVSISTGPFSWTLYRLFQRDPGSSAIIYVTVNCPCVPRLQKNKWWQ